MYKWATNMTADTEAADDTITTVETIGSGITVTLVAGDEIVLEIGEIFYESSDSSSSACSYGMYDGTTFYPAAPWLDSAFGSFGNQFSAPANGGGPAVMRGNHFPFGNNASVGQGRNIWSQRALNLSTSEKTWQLAFRKDQGNGIIILGSSNTARWALGVRREV